MSSNRGQSFSRKVNRVKPSRFLISEDGQFQGIGPKRPFSNKKNNKRKPTHIFHTPNQYNFDIDTEEKVKVPAYELVTYKRRVFPDAEGNYPAHAVPFEEAVQGNKTRSIMIVEDVKRVPLTSRRVELSQPHN